MACPFTTTGKVVLEGFRGRSDGTGSLKTFFIDPRDGEYDAAWDSGCALGDSENGHTNRRLYGGFNGPYGHPFCGGVRNPKDIIRH